MAVSNTTMTEEVKNKRSQAYIHFERAQKLGESIPNLAYENYVKAAKIWLAIAEKNYGEEKGLLTFDRYNAAIALFNMYWVHKEPEYLERAKEIFEDARRLRMMNSKGLKGSFQGLTKEQRLLFLDMEKECFHLEEQCVDLKISHTTDSTSEEFVDSSSEELVGSSVEDPFISLNLGDYIDFMSEEEPFSIVSDAWDVTYTLFERYRKSNKPEYLEDFKSQFAEAKHLLMKYWVHLTVDQRTEFSKEIKEYVRLVKGAEALGYPAVHFSFEDGDKAPVNLPPFSTKFSMNEVPASNNNNNVCIGYEERKIDSGMVQSLINHSFSFSKYESVTAGSSGEKEQEQTDNKNNLGINKSFVI